MKNTLAGADLFKALKLAHNMNRAVDTIWRIGLYGTIGKRAIRKLSGED